MKNKKTKIFIFLITVLCVGILPTKVFALDEVTKVENSSGICEACVGPSCNSYLNSNNYGISFYQSDSEDSTLILERESTRGTYNNNLRLESLKTNGGERALSGNLGFGSSQRIPIGGIGDNYLTLIVEPTPDAVKSKCGEDSVVKLVLSVDVMHSNLDTPPIKIDIPRINAPELETGITAEKFCDGSTARFQDYGGNASEFCNAYNFAKARGAEKFEKEMVQTSELVFEGKQRSDPTSYDKKFACATSPSGSSLGTQYASKVLNAYTKFENGVENDNYQSGFNDSNAYYLNENTKAIIGHAEEEIDVGSYRYRFSYQNSSNYLNEDIKCTIGCDEVVISRYGPPVATSNGVNIQYKVKVESFVRCYVLTPPNAPREDYYIRENPKATCSHSSSGSSSGGGGGPSGGGVQSDQAGPNEDFDKCIMKCDKGKYTNKCTKKCYKEVYGKSLSAKKTLTFRNYYLQKLRSNMSDEECEKQGAQIGTESMQNTRLQCCIDKQNPYSCQDGIVGSNQYIGSFCSGYGDDANPSILSNMGNGSYYTTRKAGSGGKCENIKWTDPTTLSRTYKDYGEEAGQALTQKCWHKCVGTDPGGISANCDCNPSICKYVVQGGGAPAELDACDRYLNDPELQEDIQYNNQQYERAIEICKRSKPALSRYTAEFTIAAEYKTTEGKSGAVYYPGPSESETKVTINSNGVCYLNGSYPNYGVTVDKVIKNTLYNVGGGYGETATMCTNNGSLTPYRYMAEWGLSGFFIKKNGDVSYISKSGYKFRESKQLPLLRKQASVNTAWWNFIHGTASKTDPESSYSDQSYTQSIIPDPTNCAKTTVDSYTGNKYFTSPADSSIDYNIHAYTKNFGFFNWNLYVDCFYATNRSQNPTVNPEDNGVDKRENDKCEEQEYETRTIDPGDPFPSRDGTPVGKEAGLSEASYHYSSNAGYSSDVGGYFGRTPGYNWTKYATNDLDSQYQSYPDKYGLFVQMKNDAIFSNDYLDYSFHLTPQNLRDIRNEAGRQNFGNLDNGNYEFASGTGGSGNTHQKTVSHYTSNFIRNGRYFDESHYPTGNAIKCNNMNNYSSQSCFDVNSVIN